MSAVNGSIRITKSLADDGAVTIDVEYDGLHRYEIFGLLTTELDRQRAVITEGPPVTDRYGIWCEHCRDHFCLSHYDADGNHRVGLQYGPTGQQMGNPQAPTTEVVVICSYCEELATVPFQHGAVIPDRRSDTGVIAFIPRLDGGDHECTSGRHADDRRAYEKYERPAREERNRG